MKIQHKFLDELELLESKQIFCGKELAKRSNILVIGTFNPNSESVEKPNLATWFYGRESNWFWRYLPESLNQMSLHPKNGGSETAWKEFCLINRVVLVDLIKEIDGKNQLPDFKDGRIDKAIQENLDNVSVFDFEKAFQGIKFEKVIFTRKGWNPSTNRDILKLIRIKCGVVELLLSNNIVNGIDNVRYCPAPWTKRKSTFEQWKSAVNN
ncbi:MAG: hypothetical protein AAGF96_18090 [Bacteroidota bacterium]